MFDLNEPQWELKLIVVATRVAPISSNSQHRKRPPKCQTIPFSWRKSVHLDQPEECFVCMAGDFSAAAISSSSAPSVLQLLRLAHCSGGHPPWRGTRTASRPYGRLGSRWQTPPCQPCTVCKLEWCTARRSPAGTSPPARKAEKKIIAQLRLKNSTISCWSTWSLWVGFLWKTTRVKALIKRLKITIKSLDTFLKPSHPPGWWCKDITARKQRKHKRGHVALFGFQIGMLTRPNLTT